MLEGVSLIETHILIRLILFGVFSTGLIVVFRRDLRNWRTHGFYRFFAFESIMGLVFINSLWWFEAPFSFRQIISWIFLSGSLFLALNGFTLLHKRGRPMKGIETTTNLVKQGAYRYIRHPLYASLLLFAWGFLLKSISLLSTSLVLVASICLYITAKIEEEENLDRFGEDYADYMRNTRMFIPYLF